MVLWYDLLVSDILKPDEAIPTALSKNMSYETRYYPAEIMGPLARKEARETHASRCVCLFPGEIPRVIQTTSKGV